MVYQSTEMTRANAEGKRLAILAATLDIISKRGISAVTTEAIQKRLNVSVGTLYNYFGSRDKMLAAAMGQLLESHVSEMRRAEDGFQGPDRFVAAIMAFYSRLQKPLLVDAMVTCPEYRIGLQDELAGLVMRVSNLPLKDRRAAAGAILGMLCGAWAATGGRMSARTGARFALQFIGLTEANARKALA